MLYLLPLLCSVNFATTDSSSGTLARCFFSCAPKYGVIFATYLNLISTKTQNFIPYLSGLLGIKVIKEEHDFRGMDCLSTIRKKFHVLGLTPGSKSIKNISYWCKLVSCRNHFLFCLACRRIANTSIFL